MRIAGRVVNSATADGIPELAVAFTDVGRDHILGVARTDAKGRFVLEVPGAHKALIATVRARDGRQLAEVEVKVEPDGGEVVIEVELPREREPRAPRAPLEERERIDRQIEEDYRRVSGAAERADFVEELRAGRERRAAATEKFQGFLTALSAAPEEVRRSNRFVLPHESVRAVADSAMAEQLSGVVDGHVARGSLPLDEALLADIAVAADGTVSGNGAAKLDQLLRPPGGRFVARNPAALCAGKAPGWGGCLSHLQEDGASEPDDHDPDGDGSPAPSGPHAGGDGAVPDGTVDVPALIDALTQDIVGPGGGIGGRAGLEDIQAAVDAFALKHGPADMPAVHDFHSLRIAFEPVWAELFAGNVTGSGEKLYEQLVEVGEDPNLYLLMDEFNFKFPTTDKGGKPTSGGKKPGPSADVVKVFDVAPLQWGVLGKKKRDELETLADEYLTLRHLPPTKEITWPFGGALIVQLDEATLKERERQMRSKRIEGEGILRWADKHVEHADRFDEYHETLRALSAAMKEPYRFSIYAANRVERSINFGVVCNYRQTWSPISYQPGRLVRTIPLAPKEVRRFTKKVTQSTSRSRKEIDNRLRSRTSETSETVRGEAEIIEKARAKTNFAANAEGSFDMAVAGAKASQAFGSEDEKESAETKREFREAIRKASEEFKTEHNIEINTTGSTEDVSEETGEISNPNDEITVTYLFYELERRYQLAEELQSVTPVVLVAQEVPKPDEIDEDWLIAHDWIIRRTILDDSFVPALDYLSTGMVGHEAALDEQRRTLEQQRTVVSDLKDQLIVLQREVGRRYAALESSIRRKARAVQADEEEGFLEEAWESNFGSGDTSVEAQEVRERAAKDAFDRATKNQQDLEHRLASETASITEMTRIYSEAVAEHLNRRAQIARLRVHVKSNVLYYMQAIWSYEPPDQRFFRLHEVPVPRLKGTKTYVIIDDPDAEPAPPSFKQPKKVELRTQLRSVRTDPLESVADLDNLLGFKGNYMIFPLREGNDLTDMMTLPYADPELGLRDPDPNAGWTLSQFADYVCCMHDAVSPIEWAALRPKLLAFYLNLLEHGAGEDDEIVVPTGSLFIEALPGSHPVLEDFKLLHRVTDVRQALADVRMRELENVRAAARLLSGEREDPSIEKKVVITGPASVDVDVDTEPEP